MGAIMKRPVSYMFITGLLILFTITSCATFKSDISESFNRQAEKNYGADPVSVLFVFRHSRQTIGYDAIPKLDNKRQRISGFDEIFLDALSEFSNIGRYSTFTEYASDVNEPERRAIRDSMKKMHDFVIHVHFLREKSFAKHFLGSVVSTLTLTLFPTPYVNSYSAEIDIYNQKQHLIKSYKRQAALTKWVQTLLLFVYPFHPEKRKKEEIYVDILHDVFRQIETERILKK